RGRSGAFRRPTCKTFFELRLQLNRVELAGHGQDGIARREVRFVELQNDVALDASQRQLVAAFGPRVGMLPEKIAVVVAENDRLRLILRRFDTINALRKKFVHFRLWKRRVQHGIAQKIQALVQVFRQTLGGQRSEIATRIRSKAGADKIQVFREL